MDKIKCLAFAAKWYDEKKLAHAVKVASYAAADPFASEDDRDSLWAVGLFHDILEDTDCTVEDLREFGELSHWEITPIELLTHHKEDCSYEDYIQAILASKDPFALAVKRADMKDHMMRVDTLTDKLKKKYYPVIKYLL